MIRFRRFAPLLVLSIAAACATVDPDPITDADYRGYFDDYGYYDYYDAGYFDDGYYDDDWFYDYYDYHDYGYYDDYDTDWFDWEEDGLF